MVKLICILIASGFVGTQMNTICLSVSHKGYLIVQFQKTNDKYFDVGSTGGIKLFRYESK
jgi:hypothetical protein